MSIATSSSTNNTMALLDSIRRFTEEIQLRIDAIDTIVKVEGAIRDIVLEQDLRLHKAPPVKLTRFRRIES